jgi:pyruvate ferredoxin oxidoreductase alpha subunit
MKKVLEGSIAVAEAAALCEPKVISAYPITPQTHIVEELASLVAGGKLAAQYIPVESEFSAISACIGASAAGVRCFTATSSQGLALMHEALFNASGMRLPMVMLVANRALGAPLNIWNDQQDSMSERDSGWVQLYCESNQEAVDTTIQAFKIAEASAVPVMVCMDGFFLTHTVEPIDVPERAAVKKFLPDFKPRVMLDAKNPKTLGAYAMPDAYQEFRKAQEEAMQDARSAIIAANDEFANVFGRKYGNGLLEADCSDADYVLLSVGSVLGAARVVAAALRRKGERVGVLKLRSFRPLPKEELRRALSGKKAIGVFEKDVSIGTGAGALYSETRDALQGSGACVCGFVGGLGGRDVTTKHVEAMFKRIMQCKEGVEWVG